MALQFVLSHLSSGVLPNMGQYPARLKKLLRPWLGGEINHSSLNCAQTREWEIGLDLLLGLEEYYWQQRARSDWLQSSDRNTKFFHSKANSQRSKNQIRGLEKRDGNGVDSEQDICREIEEYFGSFFLS